MADTDDLLMGTKAGRDSDGDGVSDAQEALDGTDAHDAASHALPEVDAKLETAPIDELLRDQPELETEFVKDAMLPEGHTVSDGLADMMGPDGKAIDTTPGRDALGDTTGRPSVNDSPLGGLMQPGGKASSSGKDGQDSNGPKNTLGDDVARPDEGATFTKPGGTSGTPTFKESGNAEEPHAGEAPPDAVGAPDWGLVGADRSVMGELPPISGTGHITYKDTMPGSNGTITEHWEGGEYLGALYEGTKADGTSYTLLYDKDNHIIPKGYEDPDSAGSGGQAPLTEEEVADALELRDSIYGGDRADDEGMDVAGPVKVSNQDLAGNPNVEDVGTVTGTTTPSVNPGNIDYGDPNDPNSPTTGGGVGGGGDDEPRTASSAATAVTGDGGTGTVTTVGGTASGVQTIATGDSAGSTDVLMGRPSADEAVDLAEPAQTAPGRAGVIADEPVLQDGPAPLDVDLTLGLELADASADPGYDTSGSDDGEGSPVGQEDDLVDG